MLMKTIDNGTEDHQFQIDRRSGHHLVFSSRAEREGPHPYRPHWVGTCANEQSLDAMVRWMALRRDQ